MFFFFTRLLVYFARSHKVRTYIYKIHQHSPHSHIKNTFENVGNFRLYEWMFYQFTPFFSLVSPCSTYEWCICVLLKRFTLFFQMTITRLFLLGLLIWLCVPYELIYNILRSLSPFLSLSIYIFLVTKCHTVQRMYTNVCRRQRHTTNTQKNMNLYRRFAWEVTFLSRLFRVFLQTDATAKTHNHSLVHFVNWWKSSFCSYPRRISRRIFYCCRVSVDVIVYFSADLCFL